MVDLVGYGSLGLYTTILLLKYVASRIYLARNPDLLSDPQASVTLPLPAHGAPLVSVLQPILSGDPLLESTLRRTISVSSTRAIFWLLVDTDDPVGIQVAAAIANDHGHRVRSIPCDPPPQAVNPKIFKLQQVLTRIDTPFIAVLDDDTWLAHDNLDKAMARLDTCDLYTGLPVYVSADDLWSSLVAHFVNNNSITTYLSLLIVTDPITINGMFYVMRTDTLRAMGGWAPLADQLCDDLAVAQAAIRAGLRIHQGTTPQYINTTVGNWRAYFKLMHRWYLFANVLVKRQSRYTQSLMGLLLGLPPLLLWCGLIAVWHSVGGPFALILVLLVRHVLIVDLLQRVCGTAPDINGWRSLVSELIQPVHWLTSLVSRTITWRSRRIVVEADGGFRYIDAVCGDSAA